MTRYTFRPVLTESTTALADALPQMSESDLSGTIDDAQEFARAYGCEVELSDAAGFTRGTVTEDGYSLR